MVRVLVLEGTSGRGRVSGEENSFGGGWWVRRHGLLTFGRGFDESGSRVKSDRSERVPEGSKKFMWGR